MSIWFCNDLSTLVVLVANVCTPARFLGPCMIRLTPKLVWKEKILISVFSKRGFQNFWCLAKWRSFLIHFFYEKWQKLLKIGVNMVSPFYQKWKYSKSPHLKIQILIISTSKPNLVSIWPTNQTQPIFYIIYLRCGKWCDKTWFSWEGVCFRDACRGEN